MADITNSVWSETDASNTTAAPDGAPEGMAPSGVNDVLRAHQGAIKRAYNWTIPKGTAGTSTAYTLSYGVAPGALVDGMSHLVSFHTANGSSPTLNVNSLGAKPLYSYQSGAWAAVPSGVITADMHCRVSYHSSSGTYRITSVSVPPEAVAVSVTAVRVQTFTASGTYTPDAKMLYATIECWGGGGGGGGAAVAASVNQAATGGGGGAGGYSRKTVTASTVGASQTVTIGAAGTAGSAGNNAGGNGGDTSVGTLCVGKGGTGGGGNSGSATAVATAGAGGVAGTGDIAALGDNGDVGACYVQNVASKGGSTLLGSGGAAQNGASSTAGGAATGYGAGGGGGYAPNGASNAAGGAGTAGYVIVTEYCWG